MTSPVQDFEPFEDESELLLGDVSQADEPEEEEGEELFGDNMEKYLKFIFNIWFDSYNLL